MIRGLDIQGYKGLDKHRYNGLDTLIRAALPRPVHIVRQTISNLDMGNISLLAYHRYKGLSSPAGARVHREDIPNHYIYKPYMPDMRILGYKGLKGLKV